MNGSEIRQRLELRYRVYHSILTLFYVEDLEFHVGQLFELSLVADSSDEKSDRMKCAPRFLAQTKSLCRNQWITSEDKEEFDAVYRSRTDIAHETLTGLGTLVWDPSKFDEMMAQVEEKRRPNTPKEFDFSLADRARRTAYIAAKYEADHRGVTGDLAGFFTRQSIPFSQIEELIMLELEMIEKEWQQTQI